MPTSDSGIPYPAGPYAPDGAAQLMAMAEFLDLHTVLHATDEANRDALWGDFPAPVLVLSKARPAIWLKVADDGLATDWRTIWSDSGQVTTGFTVGTNFTLVSAWVRKTGGAVDFFAQLTASADFGPTTPSNIHAGNLAGDPIILTIPAAYAPPVQTPVLVSSSFGSWGGRVQTDGKVQIYDGPPDATLSDGDFVTIHANWRRYGD